MNVLVLGEARSIHQQRIAGALAARGHEITFVTFAPALLPGIEVIDLADGSGSVPFLRFMRKVRRLRSLIRDRRIDVLHAHYISVYGLLAALAGPVPKILTVHGSDVLLARRTRYNRAVMRFVARRMDGFTSPAPHVTEALFLLGAEAGRIATFQYGVDCRRFHPRLAPRRGDETLKIISTRSLEPLYRVELLLMALSRMACGNRLRTVIAGEGAEAEPLAQLAWSLQLEDEVAFTGSLDEDGVAGALREADLYVSTSPTDGASLSLLEAMATGLLPIAPDIPANREWIRHAENGLLYRPGSPDALAEAIASGLHEGALREKARTENPAIIRDRADFGVGIRRLAEILENAVEGRGSR
ncbi:MAG: glycosyltransferase [Deltaproteobacteria bacterium]|nr:glycosyltransferase [Deltaproteobacteria bacterium]